MECEQRLIRAWESGEPDKYELQSNRVKVGLCIV